MKKYFTVFLAFIIYFNVFSQAHAAKNYNVRTIVYDPLEKVINATVLDQIAEKTMQRTAKVPVTASATGSTVASMARLGLLGAVVYGIIQGVGWVIDNGVIKKPINTTIENWEYIYYCNGTPGQSANSACNTHLAQGKQLGYYPSSMNVSSCTKVDISTNKGTCLFSDGKTSFDITYDYVKNPNYVPSTTLVPVSETDIGNEVNNSPQAPQVLPDIYNPNNPAGGKAPESTADALDNASPIPETEPTGSTRPKPNKDTDGDGKPDVHDPTLPSEGEDFTLPEFCSWAVTMCEWYKKYKEDSKQAEAQRESEQVAWQREEIARQQEEAQREKERSFWEKASDFFDWTKDDKDDGDQEEQEPDSSVLDKKFDTTFSAGGSCPPNPQIEFPVVGVVELPFSKICTFFSYLKFGVLTGASLLACWIVSSAVRGAQT